MKKEQYNRDVEDYNKWLKECREKCDFQKYIHQSMLCYSEMLKKLCELQNDDNAFHALTISPTREEGIEGYMERGTCILHTDITY